MNFKYVFFVTFILMIAACTKDKAEDNTVYVDTPETLIGSWNWLYSSGGFAGITQTPQSTGETKRVEFDRDNVCRVYINNLLKSEQKFKVEKGKTITSQDSAIILTNTSGTRQSITFRTSDTLILFDECFDCFEHYYNRIK